MRYEYGTNEKTRDFIIYFREPCGFPMDKQLTFINYLNLERLEQMTINEWAIKIHNWAKSKGWWNEPRNTLALHMLMVTEIAEASEAYRKNEPSLWFENDGKPCGEASEIVDTIIRCLDYMQYRKEKAADGETGTNVDISEYWDIEYIMELKHKYNETRPYRHGGKKE